MNEFTESSDDAEPIRELPPRQATDALEATAELDDETDAFEPVPNTDAADGARLIAENAATAPLETSAIDGAPHTEDISSATRLSEQETPLRVADDSTGAESNLENSSNAVLDGQADRALQREMAEPREAEFRDVEFRTDAGSAFFDLEDEDYRAAAHDVPSYPGEYVLDVHGTPESVQLFVSDKLKAELNASEFANVVRSSTEWNGEPIRLFSCDTGAAADGFAQALADDLEVKVTAPTKPVWSVSRGHEPIVSEAVFNPETGRHEPKRPPTGTWMEFTPKGKGDTA